MRYTTKLVIKSALIGVVIGYFIGAFSIIIYQIYHEQELTHPKQVEVDIGTGLMAKKPFWYGGTQIHITPRADGSGIVRVGWKPGRR